MLLQHSALPASTGWLWSRPGDLLGVMPSREPVAVALGSNPGDSLATLTWAVSALKSMSNPWRKKVVAETLVFGKLHECFCFGAMPTRVPDQVAGGAWDALHRVRDGDIAMVLLYTSFFQGIHGRHLVSPRHGLGGNRAGAHQFVAAEGHTTAPIDGSIMDGTDALCHLILLPDSHTSPARGMELASWA